MINASRRALLPRRRTPPPTVPPNARSRHVQHRPATEFSLVAALKSSSLSSGEQIHSFALRSGFLPSNLFVRNGLIHLYARCDRASAAHCLFLSAPSLDTASWNIMIAAHVRSRRLDDALDLFDKMPRRDCVSFTTVIMGLAQQGSPSEALAVFRRMLAADVAPNEVTLATVVSACACLPDFSAAKAAHAAALKLGLDAFVLVSTNLVHTYAVFSELDCSEAVFFAMPERNLVTWNAMLNGYAKAGLLDSAVGLFEEMPVRDVVSWGTLIDGCLRVDRLGRALFAYREMLRETDARPNEVMLVDLVSACGRLSAVLIGRQLHAVVVRTGFDCHAFVQATLIHFYASCRDIDRAFLQFESGDQCHVSSWNAMIGGFLRNDKLDSARNLFDVMPERDVVSWSTLIAGYVQNRRPDLALELFHEMLDSRVQPNEITLVSVLSAVANCGSLEQGKWLHSYINDNSINLSDNLIAGLIDMYAKCGCIRDARQVFNHTKEKSLSVSPWNAIICGLAMHGDAELSLAIFMELKRTQIRPNSITFIGVLSACCHAGLVLSGKHHFESMKIEYNIEPTMKHYGCMVDLLGRAGCLEDAERMIKAMPMKADVVIWGSMLAAARTHGDVEIGERAARSLAMLEPSHGAGRVLLSNIYADVGMWDEVINVRREMQNQRLKKLPGCSGIA